MKVLAYDKFQNNYDMAGVTTCDDLELIYQEADVLSFHVPLHQETRHYFNFEMLGKMQRPFILLNLSRGSVVEQNAVYEGLISGKILGAALDVWEEEPFWKHNNSPLHQQALALMKMPNFIGTPHIGGYTYDALYKMSKVLADKVENNI
jgi:D-3-phosphoglycerate dehydrogenase